MFPLFYSPFSLIPSLSSLCSSRHVFYIDLFYSIPPFILIHLIPSLSPDPSSNQPVPWVASSCFMCQVVVGGLVGSFSRSLLEYSQRSTFFFLLPFVVGLHSKLLEFRVNWMRFLYVYQVESFAFSRYQLSLSIFAGFNVFCFLIGRWKANSNGGVFFTCLLYTLVIARRWLLRFVFWNVCRLHLQGSDESY